MILRRIIVILIIMIITCLIGTGLLVLGNFSKESNSNIEIYTEAENIIKEKEVVEEDISDKMIENNKSIEVPKDNVMQETKIFKSGSDNNVNNSNENSIVESIKNDNELNDKNSIRKQEEAKANSVPIKEDVYTFVKNDVEIQNMIFITKKIILENNENRYSELVDNVDNINFIIEKSGNLFYPLYEYRIANIVMDNYYPEFYVYAEDVYKNGEYLRTEYYFQ